MGNESPVIRFVNYLIFDALKQGASDIHIEPKEKQLKVRYRIDGVLFEAMTPPHTMHAAIVSRMKIMANLDISERRLPQDGRIRAVIQSRKIDLRMSTLPTTSGEKVVMRILDQKSISVPLEALGFSENALTIWRKLIEEPHGIILVTGPTGSGKTTTLYSSLKCMDGNKLNISTVEDPIEYHLAQANQTQVHDKIGMTFSAALRALLRQDPDVVMLGEIRDAETAKIAVQASLTGHLVLSTLHTNDAPSSVTRLINIGLEPYLIASAVNAILAQRLVRKVCQHCKEPYQPTDEMKEFLTLQGFDSTQLFQGKGCDRCRMTGYAGRLGIYELLVMDDGLRDLVTRNPNVTELRKLCRERGLITLRQDGFDKVTKGLTTIDEIIRVTESGV
jgi:type IV pilus assembly protein PilB